MASSQYCVSLNVMFSPPPCRLGRLSLCAGPLCLSSQPLLGDHTIHKRIGHCPHQDPLVFWVSLENFSHGFPVLNHRCKSVLAHVVSSFLVLLRGLLYVCNSHMSSTFLCASGFLLTHGLFCDTVNATWRRYSERTHKKITQGLRPYATRVC